jgi:hypothetical protein
MMEETIDHKTLLRRKAGALSVLSYPPTYFPHLNLFLVPLGQWLI